MLTKLLGARLCKKKTIAPTTKTMTATRMAIWMGVRSCKFITQSSCFMV